MAVNLLAPWSGADGAVATAANTGFSSVVKTDTAATILFEDSWKPRGRNSLEMRGTTTAGYALGVLTAPAPTDTVALDIPWDLIEIPSAEQSVVSFHGADDTRLWSLAVFASGALTVRDAAAATRWTGSGASPTGVVSTAAAPYILRIFMSRNATTGTFRVQIVNEADGTVIANGDTGLRTGQNTGAQQITHMKISAKSASSSVIPAKYAFGIPRYDWAATDLIPLWTQRTGVQFAHPTTGLWTEGTVQIQNPVGGGWLTVSLP